MRCGFSKKGFTLVGVLVIIVILSGLFAFMGRSTPFIVRSRLRSEAKASFSKSVDAVTGLIARRVNQVLTDSCPLNSDDFLLSFNSTTLIPPGPPAFPGTPTSLIMEKGGDLELSKFPNPPSSLPDMKRDLDFCRQGNSVQVPASPSDPGTFIFCLSLKAPAKQTLSDFVDSQAVFIPVRIDLFSSETPQDSKVTGTPVVCSSFISSPNEKRQIKVSYTVYWKRFGDDTDLGFFSFTNSSLLNVDEIQ